MVQNVEVYTSTAPLGAVSSVCFIESSSATTRSSVTAHTRSRRQRHLVRCVEGGDANVVWCFIVSLVVTFKLCKLLVSVSKQSLCDLIQ